MSQQKVSSPVSSRADKTPNADKNSAIPRDYVYVQEEKDEAYFVTPEFIYGGPFVEVKKPSPFIDTITPINLPLQGTFRKSFAYFSLKDRLPVILTRIIDYLARDGAKIQSSCGASSEDITKFIQWITKLKYDLITNKDYTLFEIDTPEAKKWNEWIANLDNKKYFNNIWVFSECYVYRKLYEGCELFKSLKDFDYFGQQKEQSFHANMQWMCLVADKLVNMWNKSEKDKRKADFVTLLKLCLWANKCDLSLSVGEQVVVGAAAEDKNASKDVTPPPPGTAPSSGKDKVKPLNCYLDPFQMIIDMKDKLLVDDTSKIADQVVTKAENMRKAIEGPPSEIQDEEPKEVQKNDSNSPPSDPPVEAEVKEEEPPKIPCPAKMTIPNHVMFDIICDNAGYELFTDLCLASFLIEQKIVQKIRFHVKKLPWFVSDVTPRDFKYTIEACLKANFQKETAAKDPEGEDTDGKDNDKVKDEPADEQPSKSLNSDNLKLLGEKWNSFVEDGSFVVMADDYWTYPHVFRDMKKYDYNLYRSLQYAAAIMFKGDLNYRKLLGDRNVNPYIGFETCLQGFMPAPIIAVRTVKADLICGLPKPKPRQMGKYEQLQKLDEHWMEKGDYGLIQYCGKAEALKVSDRPCIDYGDTCRGTACRTHDHDM